MKIVKIAPKQMIGEELEMSWYLAKIIEQQTVESDPHNVVDVNWVLIQADSAENAYSEALDFGNDIVNAEYLNEDNHKVHIRFRGLRDLLFVADEIISGTALREYEPTEEKGHELQQLIKPREELFLFAKKPEYKESQRRKYLDIEFLKELLEYVKNLQNNQSDPTPSVGAVAQDQEWFLAEQLHESFDTTSFKVRYVAILAYSSDSAYDKALEFGNNYARSNQQNFLGLINLYRIDEGIEDGSEITYQDYYNLPEEEIRTLITEKEDLSVFKQALYD